MFGCHHALYPFNLCDASKVNNLCNVFFFFDWHNLCNVGCRLASLLEERRWLSVAADGILVAVTPSRLWGPKWRISRSFLESIHVGFTTAQLTDASLLLLQHVVVLPLLSSFLPFSICFLYWRLVPLAGFNCWMISVLGLNGKGSPVQ